MGEVPAKASSGPGWLRSRVATAVTTGVAVAVVFALVIVVLISPSISPLASVRDSDGDGYADSVDEFPDEEDEWNDADDDGTGDNADEFPDDPDETSDSDSDGVGDNSDAFPDDSDEWSDSDEDGVGDSVDAYPDDSEKDTPEIDCYLESDSTSVAVALTSVAPEFSWDHFMVTLTYGTDTAVWEPASEDLDGWEAMATHIYETVDVAGTGIFLTATDLSGDGLVSAFDVFMLYPDESGFDFDAEYRLSVSYEPTGEVMGDWIIYPTDFTPVSSLSVDPVTGGVRITFAAISDDVEWGDVTFGLTDGSLDDEVTNLTTEDLIDGFAVSWYAGPQLSLVGLDVAMVVTDLAGNGMVDPGDYVTLTASFSSSEYVFWVVHEPTHGIIAECVFSG